MPALLSSLYPSSLRADPGLPSPSASSPSTGSRTSWLPSSLFGSSSSSSSSVASGSSALDNPKLPRKPSNIRSAAELDLAQNGGTFPAFPFPPLSRAPGGKPRSNPELELGGSSAGAGRAGKRWSRQRVANVLYVSLFWLLVLCWLRALGGYGIADDQ